MWIMIIGAPGTGKHLVADFLSRQGYEHIDSPIVREGDEFLTHVRYSMSKLRNQLKASLMKDRANVFTIGSYWDSHLVFSALLKRFEILTDRQKTILDEIYSAYQEPGSLQPPNSVVYTTSTTTLSMDRIKLRGSDFRPEVHAECVKLFSEMMERVKTPKIEVEMAQDPDSIFKSVEFGINSMRAMNLTSGSVWNKEFFYV